MGVIGGRSAQNRMWLMEEGRDRGEGYRERIRSAYGEMEKKRPRDKILRDE